MAEPNRRVDGIDVFQNNSVSWPGVADANSSIGVAKAWHESDAGDTKFRSFWPAMRDAGLIRGAYLLVDPNANLSRKKIETMVDHYTQRIDDVGGLEPGDLPPIIDFEYVGDTVLVTQQQSLNQLAWALNRATFYTQSVLGPNALPIVYTGKGSWLNNLGNPALADMRAFVTTDGDTIDFSQFPLWWAFLGNDALDPLQAADLATVRYPLSWPGPRPFYLQYSGGVPYPNQPADQPTHDASIIAQVDAANTVSVSTDFSPLMKLASVAPPAADIELSRVPELSSQPPDQVFNLLLIGQGFWPAEFEEVVYQGLFGEFVARSPTGDAQATVHAREGVADIPPLNLLFKSAGKNGLACYVDAGTHSDGTGLYLPLRQEATSLVDSTATPPKKITYDTLRIGHQPVDPPQVRPAGRTLVEYLSHLIITLDSGTVVRASDVWPAGQRRTGPTGSLVAVLRKAQVYTTDTAPLSPPHVAEYYKLDPDQEEPIPFIAVNVVPTGDWPLVLARAIAQNLAGLGDEYELAGADFAEPPEGALSPLAPNVLNITAAERADLVAGKPPDTTVPEALTQWSIPKGVADFVARTSANPNPIAPWNSGAGAYPLGGFHMVEGGDGFRTRTLHCDRDCLMRRIPAAIANGIVAANPPAFSIQSTLQAFCEACQGRLKDVIQKRTGVKVEPRINIDSQRRLFDWIAWNDRKTLPLANVALATTVAATGPAWTCSAQFAAPDGFRFTGIKLSNVDYWAPGTPAHVANVLASVTFGNLSVTFTDKSTQTLSIPAALAAASPAPQFEAAVNGDKTGRYQVGACLSLTWKLTGPGGKALTIDGQLSLVLAAMDSDIDPAGAMVACRIYPQIALRVHSADAPSSIKSLQGAITLQANNADASNLAGTLQNIATGKLVAGLFCESNRATNDARKRATQRTADVPGSEFAKPLPYWASIYDYVNGPLSAATQIAGAFAAAEAPKGAKARDFLKTWPSGPTTSAISLHKQPRQGAYDSLCIHSDRGSDVAGRPILGGPIYADLALHLSWRRGVAWSSGPAPEHVFRGWGSGRMDQGAHTVLGAPSVPPNQHLDVTVTPAPGGSTMTVKYAVTATDVSTGRWHVFLEQGLAFAFQYAVGAADIPSWGFVRMGWLAEAIGAGSAVDINLDLLKLLLDPDGFDAKVRDIWFSILKRLRSFDPAVDGSSEQQVPDGPSDAANLQDL